MERLRSRLAAPSFDGFLIDLRLQFLATRRLLMENLAGTLGKFEYRVSLLKSPLLRKFPPTLCVSSDRSEEF